MQENFEPKQQNFAPIKGRILQYIDSQNISREKFFLKIGASKSNFSKSALKSEVSATIVSNICVQNPELSADWLLTGRGEMLKIKEYSMGIDKDFDMASECSTPYGVQKSCELCKEKDKRIEELKEQIKILKDQLIILQSLIKGIK